MHEKSLVDDLTITCDKITDTPESIEASFSNKIDYWLNVAVQLAAARLLLMVFIFFKYFKKHGFKFHAYYHTSIITEALVRQ